MVKPITLDDLKPKTIDLRIVDGGVLLLEVPIVTLTFQEWSDLVSEVPDPQPPVFKPDDTHPQPFEDRADPVYLDKMREAVEDREARVFFAILEKGGNQFPGQTALEKWHTMQRTSDRRLVVKMKEAILKTGWEGRAELVSRAETFPPEQAPADDTEGVYSVSVNGSRIPEPAA